MITVKQYVQTLRSALQQGGANEALKLGKGQCATMEDYRFGVGYIRGLEAADRLSQDIMIKLETDEDGELPEMKRPG